MAGDLASRIKDIEHNRSKERRKALREITIQFGAKLRGAKEHYLTLFPYEPDDIEQVFIEYDLYTFFSTENQVFNDMLEFMSFASNDLKWIARYEAGRLIVLAPVLAGHQTLPESDSEKETYFGNLIPNLILVKQKAHSCIDLIPTIIDSLHYVVAKWHNYTPQRGPDLRKDVQAFVKERSPALSKYMRNTLSFCERQQRLGLMRNAEIHGAPLYRIDSNWDAENIFQRFRFTYTIDGRSRSVYDYLFYCYKDTVDQSAEALRIMLSSPKGKRSDSASTGKT
jgi:hypothetical protein